MRLSRKFLWSCMEGLAFLKILSKFLKRVFFAFLTPQFCFLTFLFSDFVSNFRNFFWNQKQILNFFTYFNKISESSKTPQKSVETSIAGFSDIKISFSAVSTKRLIVAWLNKIYRANLINEKPASRKVFGTRTVIPNSSLFWSISKSLKSTDSKKSCQ